jgi:tetratricopeptide (TPR) repeat protein/S1-C subfamily serine protease
MKVYHLLISLTAITFAVTTTMPWMVHAQSTKDDGSNPQLLTLDKAQQEAAKITVKIKNGDDGGSGVLIGKKGNTYLVLTSTRVVNDNSKITLQAPDAQVYAAQKVQNIQVGNFDVAVLEFSSSRTYELAKFTNFEQRRDVVLNEERYVFAAGFSYNATGLQVLEGSVTQLPQEAFSNGAQVGYVTKGDLKQGMSGGPILDNFGNLVGINSILAYPITNDVYRYADGSKAPPDKVAEYRRANWSVPIYNFLTRLNPDVLYSYKQLPKLRRAVTPTGYMAKLDRQARLVTVRIENAASNGSGVIVARDGNTYYVLTAEHVLKNARDLKVTTHDQRSYKISPSDISRSVGTDLAVIKFTSSQVYSAAELGNYSIADKSLVFPGGWPAPKNINSQQWQWQLNPGTISSQSQGDFQTQDKYSFSNGYDLIYTSITYGGMSGGPVFDSMGKVIGIHGRAEQTDGSILGKSLGISIKTFLGLANKLGVNRQNILIKDSIPVNPTGTNLQSVELVQNNISIPNNSSDANQWIEYGNQLYRLNKYADAVKAFDRAIILQPNSILAHYGRGLALGNVGDFITALDSFDRAISLIPVSEQSKFYYLWKYRSLTLRKLQKYSESLAAISQAISLEPNDIILLNEQAVLLSRTKRNSEAIKIYDQIIDLEKKAWAYSNRGVTKSILGDNKGAIIDYDSAICINPQYTEAYYNRGVAKYAMGDNKGAIIDYDSAIRINPQYAEAYSNRGVAKLALGDKKGAIIDYDSAIRINSQYAEAYYNRGVAKYDLGNRQGAIDDYDSAIRINSQYAEAYSNRGVAKFALGDKKGAIIDYDSAIRINPQYADAYSNRGLAKYDLGNRQGAIIDYNSAVNINPQLAEAYVNRGNAKSDLGDNKGAIIDYDIALSINPQYANAYGNRGIAKYYLGDRQGAIIDYDIAIRINSQYAEAYSNRGAAKYDLGDRQGAIIDYDSAIRINPQYAEAYGNRGLAKYDLGNRQGAIDDLNIAAKLFKAQNNQAAYERTISLIQKISN